MINLEEFCRELINELHKIDIYNNSHQQSYVGFVLISQVESIIKKLKENYKFR